MARHKKVKVEDKYGPPDHKSVKSPYSMTSDWLTSIGAILAALVLAVLVPLAVSRVRTIPLAAQLTSWVWVPIALIWLIALWRMFTSWIIWRQQYIRVYDELGLVIVDQQVPFLISPLRDDMPDIVDFKNYSVTTQEQVGLQRTLHYGSVRVDGQKKSGLITFLREETIEAISAAKVRVERLEAEERTANITSARRLTSIDERMKRMEAAGQMRPAFPEPTPALPSSAKTPPSVRDEWNKYGLNN